MKFEKQKELELQEIENLKSEELRKMKLERKNQEKLSKQHQGQPSRKEREEIELLKQKLGQMQEEAKQRDTKNKLTIDRLKNQVAIWDFRTKI